MWKFDQSGLFGGKPLPVDFLGTKYGDTVQVFGAYFPPHDPNTTFITSTSHGVWISVGGTPFVEWKAIPYLRVQRLRWLPTAPGEPGAVQVATFGAGAWLLDRLCFALTDLNKFSNDQVEEEMGMCQASAGATVKVQPESMSWIDRSSVKDHVTPKRQAHLKHDRV